MQSIFDLYNKVNHSNIFLLLTLVSCTSNSNLSESEKKMIGKYKLASRMHYEILYINDNYELSSEYKSRMFEGVFNEEGKWRINKDTLFIERVRHDTLRNNGFPDKQFFLIKENRLYELTKDSKGELFESLFYFQRQ